MNSATYILSPEAQAAYARAVRAAVRLRQAVWEHRQAALTYGDFPELRRFAGEPASAELTAARAEQGLSAPWTPPVGVTPRGKAGSGGAA